jgi:hypothetical protein
MDVAQIVLPRAADGDAIDHLAGWAAERAALLV